MFLPLKRWLPLYDVFRHFRDYLELDMEDLNCLIEGFHFV